MITSGYRSGSGELRLDLPREEIAAALADQQGLLWVDLEGGDRAEGEPLLRDVFRVHQLTIDDCYNTLLDPPKVDDYGAYLFLIVHNVRYDMEAVELSSSELNLYVGPNFVVTVQRAAMRATLDVRRRAEQRNLVMERGVDFLLHALLDVVVDDFHPVVDAISEQLNVVEEEVLENPAREALQHVLRLKRNVLRLRRSILPQRDVLNRFARGEYTLIGRESLMYFRDVYDHTVRVEEMIEGLRDLSDSTLSTYLSSVNNRTNEVMKTLAITTAVFLPLTLVAGIYGTNFENVPEYDWGFAYFGMLIVMGIIAAALVAWFRWRRWL